MMSRQAIRTRTRTGEKVRGRAGSTSAHVERRTRAMATMALHSHLAYDRLIHVLLHSVENFLASALPMHCRPRSVGNFSSQPTEMQADHPEEPSRSIPRSLFDFNSAEPRGMNVCTYVCFRSRGQQIDTYRAIPMVIKTPTQRASLTNLSRAKVSGRRRHLDGNSLDVLVLLAWLDDSCPWSSESI